mmetsp:Transcript_8854/g.12603  ORF Transcript_8854/g.12603 Transcript_8854/m.12603 type:complete len:365 (-) Transcript_8854:139-1233(-)
MALSFFSNPVIMLHERIVYFLFLCTVVDSFHVSNNPHNNIYSNVRPSKKKIGNKNWNPYISQVTNRCCYYLNDSSVSCANSPLIKPPGVTLKIAIDKNGGVADARAIADGVSVRFTCPSSLDMVHRLRRVSDAVLVGSSTVRIDDPSLTVRRVDPETYVNGEGKVCEIQPVRVVIDPNLRLLIQENHNDKESDASCKNNNHDNIQKESIVQDVCIFNDEFETLIYHGHHISLPANYTNRFPNLRLVPIETDFLLQKTNGHMKKPMLSTRKVLSHLRDVLHINHVMVEGGPATALSFLNENTVDRAIVVKAPVTFDNPVPSNIDHDLMKNSGLTLLGTDMFGDDEIEYWVKHGETWPTSQFKDWP